MLKLLQTFLALLASRAAERAMTERVSIAEPGARTGTESQQDKQTGGGVLIPHIHLLKVRFISASQASLLRE